MNSHSIDLLQALSNVPAPSGDETSMRRALRPEVESYVDSLHVDTLGNLITYKRCHSEKLVGTTGRPLRVLLSAHMDEVALMVTGHTPNGYLRFAPVGGIDARILPGTHLHVGNAQIAGVIGLPSPHRTSDKTQATPIDQLVVDIGTTSKGEAIDVAPPGTYMTFATKAHRVGRLVAGKALDDRAGCTVLVSLLQSGPFSCELYGAFTVQEEVGLRGARVAAYATEPDIAVILEGTIADDLPGEKKLRPTSTVGKGPVITLMDRTYLTPPHLVRFFTETAEAMQIPYQFKRPGIGGSEARGIQPTRGGVPAIAISLPCRYIHSPVALLDPQDLEHTIALVKAALERMTPEALPLT